MLLNYFKTAWRNLTRNKIHSFINLAGLSVGLACSLLILLWVEDELGVDAFHAKGSRLYKVYEREYYAHHIDGNYDTPGMLTEELRKQIPEVEDAFTMEEDNEPAALQAGDKLLHTEGTAAGPGMFRMLSYPLVQGSPATALGSPVGIALSEKTAGQFFGSAEKAIGRTIRMNNRKDLTVTAVFRDLPANVSRRFDYVISWESWLQDNKWAREWSSSGPLSFLLLRSDADPALVGTKLAHFLDIYNKNESAGYRVELALQRYDQVYLHSQFRDGKVSGGRILYIRLFSIIAVFILLIACINFMNLSTARSVKRSREVGVRKVVGAMRSSLIRQFIGESLLLTLAAVIIAMLLTALVLPLFNQVTQKQLALPVGQPVFWLRLAAITVVTGFVAGSYPALFLSSFNPIKVLKGTLKLNAGTVWFRKGLVVFQFVLSIVLITGTIVVSRQIRYIQTSNLGYDRENLVYIPMEGSLGKKYSSWKEAAAKLSGVETVSRVSDNPVYFNSQTNSVEWEGRSPDNRVSFEHQYAGYDLLEAMKLQMREGRYFSRELSTDTNGYIINETAARKIGYDHPLGRPLTMNGRKATIIGVLKDFHFRSLHETINPLILEFSEKGSYGEILVRVRAGKTREVLAGLEDISRQLNPGFPFSYTFSDQDYLQLYKNEAVIGKLSNAFSLLAIFISCLGLLGLVMFTAEQRVREIGIRKVLGASVLNIVQMMSGGFLQLVLIAIVIASPIAWWAMSAWLDDYAYKISLQWWMLALAGGWAIAVALVTISWQAIRAAMGNPVKSLKTE